MGIIENNWGIVYYLMQKKHIPGIIFRINEHKKAGYIILNYLGDRIIFGVLFTAENIPIEPEADNTDEGT